MIEKPLVILNLPRSGSSLLRNCLAVHPDVWHLVSESHRILEGPLHPARRGYDSNRDTAESVDADTLAALQTQFYQAAFNLTRSFPRGQQLYAADTFVTRVWYRVVARAAMLHGRMIKPSAIRFVEKTPKNVLRVPFMEALFPDAHYIWLTRDPAQAIDSMIRGWRIRSYLPFVPPRFARAGYPIADQVHLQDYADKWWKFILPPGWREMEGATLAEVATWQYEVCTEIAERDLAAIPPERVYALHLEDFVDDPVHHLAAILDWAGLPPSDAVADFARNLPRVNTLRSRS